MRRGRMAGKRCVPVRFVTNDLNTLTGKESNLKNVVKHSAILRHIFDNKAPYVVRPLMI